MRRTKRNGYTRGGEHLDNMETRDEEKFVLLLHSVHHHQGRVDVTYRMRTTGSYSDPLDRQLQERVNITSFKGPILMNRRNEMGGVRVERTRYLHEMGWQLMPPLDGGLPCPTPSCKPAGGKRVVNYQDGGTWGKMEVKVLDNPFKFIQGDLISINL